MALKIQFRDLKLNLDLESFGGNFARFCHNTNNNPPSYVRPPSIASSKSVAAVKIPGAKFQGRQLEINIENLK